MAESELKEGREEGRSMQTMALKEHEVDGCGVRPGRRLAAVMHSLFFGESFREVLNRYGNAISPRNVWYRRPGRIRKPV